jgi:hypothetical protein
MLVKDLSAWAVSLLKESNEWLWNGLGGLWSWTLGLGPWFLSLGLSGQLVVTAILLGISLYVFWTARSEQIPDRILIAVTWPALYGGPVVLVGVMMFYVAWFMFGFISFMCVVFLGFFEVPIHWIFG